MVDETNPVNASPHQVVNRWLAYDKCPILEKLNCPRERYLEIDVHPWGWQRFYVTMWCRALSRHDCPLMQCAIHKTNHPPYEAPVIGVSRRQVVLADGHFLAELVVSSVLCKLLEFGYWGKKYPNLGYHKCKAVLEVIHCSAF